MHEECSQNKWIHCLILQYPYFSLTDLPVDSNSRTSHISTATATVNIAVLVLMPTVSAIFSSTDASISDKFHNGDSSSLIFWQHLIPILLSSSALVNSVNNHTIVPERVITRSVVLHLN